MRLSSLNMLRDESNNKVCGLMIGLLSICVAMGIYIYIAQVDLDWGNDLGLITFYVK